MLSNQGNADDWERTGRLPDVNDRPDEGMRFFHNHRFALEEGSYYSQIGHYSGYQDWPGGVLAWQHLLEAWETRCAPRFARWEGRRDMRVHALGGSSSSGPFVRSMEVSPMFLDGSQIRWELVREIPQDMGTVASIEELSEPGVRAQSLALVHPVDTSLDHLHQGGYGLFQVMVHGARLVTWIESDWRQGELSWRWMGSVFSWRNCQVRPVDWCDDRGHSIIHRLVEPLVREWGRLLKEVAQTTFPVSHAGASHASSQPSVGPSTSTAPDDFVNGLSI